MRIASILNEKEITLSCEVFPPKHFDGIAQASAVAQEIAGLHPSFMSVTYGAAGSTPGHTIAVAKAVAETGVTPLCHLTCVQSTREHVQHVLADMKTAGMENVLALRGDLPKEGEPCHDFAYAAELIDFIHQQGDFCVGAACYPEGHPESGSRAKDMDYLRRKVDAGVDFLTTQMFFDNSKYFDFVERCRKAGITVPIIPGIKPISTPKHLEILPRTFSVSLPEELVKAVRACGEDTQAAREVGIEWAIHQAKELKAAGVPIIHFYTMGRTDNIRKIARNVF